MDEIWPYTANALFRIVKNHDEVAFVGFKGITPCLRKHLLSKGGDGVNPPLSLIFCKHFITCAEINCFRILSDC